MNKFLTEYPQILGAALKKIYLSGIFAPLTCRKIRVFIECERGVFVYIEAEKTK